MAKYVRYVDHLYKQIGSRLGYLDIELTERCNNNCIHCCINQPEYSESARMREMSTKQIKLILLEAAELGCMQVRFTGGEPLLRSDFEELYLFTRHLGMKVLIFTNARLIDQHMANLFTHFPPKVPIEITVYGMRQESYEAVSRIPGSYYEFWRGVNLLLEHKIPFVVKSAWLPPNKHERSEFETWASEIPWMDHIPNYTMWFDLRVRRDDLIKNELIKSLRINPEEALQLIIRDPEAYRKEMEDFKAKFLGVPGEKLFCCGAGKGLWIDAYGKAQPCAGVRTPQMTVNIINSRQSSLKIAIEHFTQLYEIKASNPEYLKRCAVCFLKGLCEQCPGKSWTEHGVLDSPVDYLCEVAHAQARWMGWLDEDEYSWEISMKE